MYLSIDTPKAHVYIDSYRLLLAWFVTSVEGTIDSVALIVAESPIEKVFVFIAGYCLVDYSSTVHAVYFIWVVIASV